MVADRQLVKLLSVMQEIRRQHAGQGVLPSMCGGVDSGGLLAYGPSLNGMFRSAADYVDKIRKGAKPGELPIEQPTRFKLVVNLKMAKALGVTLPPIILAQADEMIE
jgi:putative ABC transport system substrate-binding protein